MSLVGRLCLPANGGLNAQHARRRVTVGRLSGLNQFNVPNAEQQELLGILGPLRSDIVEVESPTTGTPLPDSYKSAPPLARV